MLKKRVTATREGSQESEVEEMDRETAESSDDVESSSVSEEEDSSEMDEQDCEKRRSECIDDMLDLERQFIKLKEQLYKERVTQIERKLSEVRRGEAAEYKAPLRELQENTRVRLEVAEILKQFKLRNAEQIYEAEMAAAKQNYDNDRALIQEVMRMELMEKIRRLEEDKSSFDALPHGPEVWGEFAATASQMRARAAQQEQQMLQQQQSYQQHHQFLSHHHQPSTHLQHHGSSNSVLYSSSHGAVPMHVSKYQRRRSGNNAASAASHHHYSGGSGNYATTPAANYDIGPPKRRKTVTVSGPYIVYMLHEQDILEDWSVIRNACYQICDQYPLPL